MSFLSCPSFPLFILGRLHTGDSEGKWKESNRSFNFKFRLIDDVLSLNKVDDFVDCIYAIGLEIKDTQIQRGILHTLTYTLTLTFPTLIFLLVIDVKQFLHFPPFSKYLSELTLLFGQLIILLFLCIWTLCFIIVCLTTCLNMLERSGIEPMLYFLKMYVKQPGYRDNATNLYN
jgi:hypothetical protein